MTRTLHRSIAVAVLGMLTAGLYAVHLVDPSTVAGDKRFYTVLDIHKSFGVLILVLMVVRVLWRMNDSAPAWPPAMPSWERWSARIAQIALYIGLFVMPISGYLWASIATSAAQNAGPDSSTGRFAHQLIH